MINWLLAHLGMIGGKAKWEASLVSPGTIAIELVCVVSFDCINLVAMFVCVSWGQFWG